jgi:uncharacterized membrane protein
MKKYLKVVFGLFVSFVFVGNSYAWTITDFHSDIQLNSDGSANITEIIKTDFSQDSGKHGIFRFIPFQTKTDTGKLNRTPISNISVLNEQQIPRNFRQETKNDNILLVIGDPNRFVNPQETYVIKYRVDRVPKEFPQNNFAEFYWNVTGDGWETTIQKASATVSLPTSSQINKTTCFTGKHGGKEQNCFSRMENGKAFFATKAPLYLGQGFTIDYGFDKGIVQTFQFEDAPIWDRFVDFFNHIGVWILSIIMPFFAGFWAWQKRQSLKINKPIIPKYHPPDNLHPTLVGTVIDGKYHKRDFVAGIIDLAVQGLLTIKKRTFDGYSKKRVESYFLEQKKQEKMFISVIRANLYEHLFGEVVIPRKNGEQKGIFPIRHRKQMYKVYEAIKKDAENTKYLKKIMNFSVNLGLFGLIFWIAPRLAFSFPVVIYSVFGKIGTPILISLLSSIILWVKIIPRKTREGFKLAHEAKCYREFLKTANLDQLNWEEKQEIFEKNLPYAVAFGLTDKWASVFGDSIQFPSWLENGSMDNLSDDISDIVSDISRNIKKPAPKRFSRSYSSSSSRSSGGSGFSSSGGFSGGGSGGGGGGSW